MGLIDLHGEMTVAGQQVHSNDPCEVLRVLRAYKIKLLAGEQVEEIEVRSPVTTQRTRFTPSNVKDLDAEIERLRVACEAQCGNHQPSVVYFNTSKGL